ncbi:MAG: alpha/beta fold hydrolase [Proteobacteria bacterium]|nr:MAG: alpha/beta fold hydrolase [Pseudomonadota bacterium]
MESLMLNPFEAHPVVRGGQLQTLAAFLWPNAPHFEADEFIHVPVSGDDQVELAVNNPKGEAKANIFMMHGLGGDAQSSYKLRITRKLLPDGYRMLRLNHRGNGSKVLAAKGIYHSGSTQDVLAVIREIVKRWPDTPLLLVGFSLSGTILLNLLSWHADEIEKIPEIKGALSVCSPLDLHRSTIAVASRRNKHIDLFFARTLIDQLRKRKLISDDDIKTKFQKPTLRKVDEYVVAPLGGFRDASDYYDVCSPIKGLTKIRLPTLILTAADDPIVPPEGILEAPRSAAVTVRMERSGGHMGFLGRNLTPHKDYRWLDHFVQTWANHTLIEVLKKMV